MGKNGDCYWATEKSKIKKLKKMGGGVTILK
jgi:hypothetical protein